MKRIRLFALLLCSIVILSGCVSDNEVKQEIARLKKESKDNPLDFTVHNTSMYDPNNGIINRKDKLFQDMILEHNIHEDGEIYYFAYFYNYGGNIKLFNGYRGDCFVLLGYIRTMRHIKDMHSLTITEIIEDEKYGSYALVDWNTGNKTIRNVFMTPMAYYGYQTRHDENMISVQFQGDDKYMNVIFCGNDFERIMINKFPEKIEDGTFVGAGKNGHGQFWHQY